MRQAAKQDRARFPDGSTWVRTEPITFLHDHARALHRHAWHQLTFAASGHLEVEAEDARALVPPQCAVWVPAGIEHRELMWAPVEVRTLYLAAGALPPQPPMTRTLAISALLRELIAHVSPMGALDRERPSHAHLVDVLVDLVLTAEDVSLRLTMPRDPRARALASMIQAAPGARLPLAKLARRAGASLRTLERSFLLETGLRLGEWRRRLRLLHALRALDAGHSVTEVAIEAGYGTPSAFTAAFAALFGAPPTKYRERGVSSDRARAAIP